MRRLSFLDIIWANWKERNGRCFDWMCSSAAEVVDRVKIYVPHGFLSCLLSEGFLMDIIMLKWREVTFPFYYDVVLVLFLVAVVAIWGCILCPSILDCSHFCCSFGFGYIPFWVCSFGFWTAASLFFVPLFCIFLL